MALVPENISGLRRSSLAGKIKKLAVGTWLITKAALSGLRVYRSSQGIAEFETHEGNWPAHLMKRSFQIKASDKVVLLAMYLPRGKLSRLQMQITEDYRKLGFKVIAILATDAIAEVQSGEDRLFDGVIIVENKHFDFCSWSLAIYRFTGIEKCQELILTNDSVICRSGCTDLLADSLSMIREKRLDAYFLTESKEQRLHGQSYFIHLSQTGIEKGIIKTFKRNFLIQSKDELISKVELRLLSHLQIAGYSADCLYKAKGKRNPTLEGWGKLCRDRFPFVKVSALGFASHKVNKQVLDRYLDPYVKSLIIDHLVERYKKKPAISTKTATKHYYNEIGALVSPRLNPEVTDISCEELETFSPILKSPVFVCILHAFYVDIAISTIKHISSLGVPFRLIVTTDCNKKKEALEAFCEAQSIGIETLVYENRGRDILPLLRAVRDTQLEDIPILHLHTKRSPHNSHLVDWGNHLFNCLAGSRARLLACIELIGSTDIGIIFPEFHHEILDQLNWGYNYGNSSYIAGLLGIELNKDDYLLFPAGSMIWINRSILQRLADCPWKLEDFEEEGGQVDGTMAHAIERILIHIALDHNKEYLQVGALPPQDGKLVCASGVSEGQHMFDIVAELRTWGLSYVAPRLKEKIKSFVSSRSSPDYDVDVIFDNTNKKFLNILLPTIEVKKIYGGISTAIKVARQIYQEHSFDGIRVIVTSDATSVEAVENLSNLFNIRFDLLSPTSLRSLSSFQVCNLYHSRDRVIRVAQNDIYIATAWWTASLGRIILDKQRYMFKGDYTLLYLIQDYECGFYEWGDTYLLARTTYCDTRTTAIINSGPLFDFMTSRFIFRKTYVLPYLLNDTLKKKIACLDPDVSRFKKDLILCYGRPSTSRNCFKLIRDAISMWRKNSIDKANWKVLFIGEEFDPSLIHDIPNCECLGKLDLDKYAELLLQSKIGISLMVSPHPSYPPLEMASFGMKVITNNYDSKDLSKSNRNISSLQDPSPLTLSSLLNTLCLEKEFRLDEYVDKISDNTNVFPRDFSLHSLPSLE